MSHTPQVLNIDDFARVERVLRFKGVDHEIKELTVQQFIDNLKQAEELEKAGKLKNAPENLSAQVESTVKNILESVPTFPENELRALKVPALTAIMHFIRGDMDKEVGVGVAEDGEKKV